MSEEVGISGTGVIKVHATLFATSPLIIFARVKLSSYVGTLQGGEIKIISRSGALGIFLLRANHQTVWVQELYFRIISTDKDLWNYSHPPR